MALVRPSTMRIGVSGAAQKVQACEQPRYGLIVHRKGTWLISGTRFSADFARTSKNFTPIASGASKWRTTAGSEYPGRRSSSSVVIFRLSHLIEQMFAYGQDGFAGSVTVAD